MASYHHKPIKRFTVDGVIYDDALISRLRIEYYKLITYGMRASGYVPRLDIEQDFTIKYNEKTKYFEFKLSIYGIFIGKKKSEWILGIDGATPIFIQQSKSSEYLQERAST